MRAARSLLLLAALSGPALAHDFWIQPGTFRPEPGKRITVALRVGDHFVGEPIARSGSRIVKFIAVGEDGETPIVGRDGDEPAGMARLSRPGLYTLGYRSNHAFVELEPAKFDHYLKEKGLEFVIAERARRGESQRVAREAYSRCSKALVRVGHGKPSDEGKGMQAGNDRELSFTLEIVAETDPTASQPGADQRFRVQHDGKPLAGALVTATRHGASEQMMSARTEADGRVTFRLTDGGTWLIAAVHMVRAPEKAEFEWESFWASLTFELSSGAMKTPLAGEAASAPPAAK